jgi:hypothetical protein
MTVAFVINDGGRAAAGFKGVTGDCGVRAAAIALQRPYQEVYDALFERAKAFKAKSRKAAVKKSSASPRNGVWREVLWPYIEDAGGVWVPLAGIGLTPVRVFQVAARWPRERLVLSLARHYSAMVDGMIHDAWPQHDEKRVYGVWVIG